MEDKKTLLIVEDDKYIINFISMTLKKEEYAFFVAKSVEEAVSLIYANQPDLIILDPPRDGVHPKALPRILDYGVEKLVYISCKPSSLARDLKVFEERGYRMEKCVGVDQFCQTVHCEVISLFVKNK